MVQCSKCKKVSINWRTILETAVLIAELTDILIIMWMFNIEEN